MKKPVVLVAASGLAREVMATIEAEGAYRVVAILDDDPDLRGTQIGGVPVVFGTVSAARFDEALFIVCAGAGAARRRIVDRLAGFGIGPERFATVAHPSAVVPASCRIGRGSMLLAHVTLTADVIVGDHVVLMPQVVLTHDDQVGDFATICAGAALGGRVWVGSAAYVGMNSSIRQNLRVGEASTLGMGSVLIRDLPDGQTWAGVPAVEVQTGSRDRSQLLAIPGRPSSLLATERIEAP